MQAGNILNSSIGQLSGSELFQRKSSFIISSFMFFTCMFTGIFFSMCVSVADKKLIIEPVNQLIAANSNGVLPSFIANMILLFLIFIAGLSVYGFALAFLVLAGKSLALGFTGGLIYNTLGVKIIILSLIPSNLFLVAALIPAVSVSVNYASENMLRRSVRSEYMTEYLILFGIFSLLILLAAFVEAITLRLF